MAPTVHVRAFKIRQVARHATVIAILEAGKAPSTCSILPLTVGKLSQQQSECL